LACRITNGLNGLPAVGELWAWEQTTIADVSTTNTRRAIHLGGIE
jgi:hypothetical protein